MLQSKCKDLYWIPNIHIKADVSSQVAVHSHYGFGFEFEVTVQFTADQFFQTLNVQSRTQYGAVTQG